MPDNVLNIGVELYSVIAGTIVLFGAALAFAFKYRAASDKAGAKGQRPTGEAKAAEITSPDGFIDGFAGVISEAGGGVPFMATLIILVTAISWLVYLIANWKG